MAQAILFRFEARGAWSAAESGPSLVASDTFYGAVCAAMDRFGWLAEWLAAGSAVRLSSLFPWQHGTLFAPPPASAWPPTNGLQRLRPKLVRFLPLPAIRDLLSEGGLAESRWVLDPGSGCLLAADRAGAGGPFRPLRVEKAAGPKSGVQFADGAGVWGVAVCEDEQWRGRLEAALRWLADSGLGGNRALGWGGSAGVRIEGGDDIAGLLRRGAAGDGSKGWWLLSLFAPGAEEEVFWDQGAYRLAVRSGWVEGTTVAKRAQRVVAEGSVVFAPAAPAGSLQDVAPEGWAHPVYRNGYAVAVPL
jgi:CRISPR/Cas system CSM-associated protein Csm4 (group 5 of RAMP superfamily)